MGARAQPLSSGLALAGEGAVGAADAGVQTRPTDQAVIAGADKAKKRGLLVDEPAESKDPSDSN